ncbi:MAG: hypothetical protein DI598_13710 [Pseudopedobacter saltans]|uniref:Sensor of ECF-type sigma factor n=1 Tax=Pseudopedobacter saltans TaxID=151895 RepID=A0A2W5EUY3_9SPHI|nr:MAG: hypothetical protein DI598_13710 [Pseudopedobacter saltans]
MKKNPAKKSKKKYYLVVFFSISLYLCHAQMLNSRQGKLETIKMSYITKKLNLSGKEAQEFWVIYPQYLKDLSTVRHNCPSDEIQCEEGILNVRKKYKAKMLPVLKTNKRVDEVFTLEKSYREVLRKELRKRYNVTDSLE